MVFASRTTPQLVSVLCCTLLTAGCLDWNTSLLFPDAAVDGRAPDSVAPVDGRLDGRDDSAGDARVDDLES